MINEHQGGVECRSPLHSPLVGRSPRGGQASRLYSRTARRLAPPPRWGAPVGAVRGRLRRLPDKIGLLAPVGPLRSGFRPPPLGRPRGGRWRRPAVAPGLRLPPPAAPGAPVGSRRGPPASACRRLRSPGPPAPRPAPLRRAPGSPAGSPGAVPRRSPRSSGCPRSAPGALAGSLRLARAPAGPWAAPGGGAPWRGPLRSAPGLRLRLRPPGLRPPALGRARALAGPLGVRSRAGGLGLGSAACGRRLRLPPLVYKASLCSWRLTPPGIHASR